MFVTLCVLGEKRQENIMSEEALWPYFTKDSPSKKTSHKKLGSPSTEGTGETVQQVKTLTNKPEDLKFNPPDTYGGQRELRTDS